MKFQVMVGFSGATVQTTVESGYVELDKGVTGKFVLTDLSKYHEKTNDELTYNPNSTLSANSVVQIMVQEAFVGATFVITGIDSYSSIRNIDYTDAHPNAVVYGDYVADYVEQSKLVIKQDEPEEVGEKYEYTLSQPDNQSIKIFVNIVATSFLLGMVAMVIYLLKSKKTEER